MKEIASLNILPSPVGLRAMRLFIKTFADGAGVDYETANDLCVACGEAVNNVIEHGGAPDGVLCLEWWEDDAQLEVRILDKSTSAMPAAPAGPLDLNRVMERERGLGLYLMKNLVDEVRVAPRDGGGNITALMMRKGEAL